MKADKFWQWFEREMARRGYRSVRQVERAGDVGNDTISGRQRRGSPPTDTIIRAIAQAFDLPFEAVQQAGDATTPTQDSAAETSSPLEHTNLTLRELWGIVSEMPVEDQRAVLDYALFRRSRTDAPRAESAQRERGANRRSPAATDGG